VIKTSCKGICGVFTKFLMDNRYIFSYIFADKHPDCKTSIQEWSLGHVAICCAMAVSCKNAKTTDPDPEEIQAQKISTLQFATPF